MYRDTFGHDNFPFLHGNGTHDNLEYPDCSAFESFEFCVPEQCSV